MTSEKKPRRKNAQAALTVAQKRDAWILRTEGGLTYDAIAQQIGTAKSTVWRYITSELEKQSKQTEEMAAQYRQEQIARLEALYQEATKISSMTARIRTRVTIIQSLNKLHGLDAKVHHIHKDGTDELLFAGAPEGEALDRMRRARAELAEMDVAERRGVLIRREDVQSAFQTIDKHLRRFGEDLRRCGNMSIPAPELLDKFNDMLRAIQQDHDDNVRVIEATQQEA
jgi:AcrR family transcriptional regulator